MKLVILSLLLLAVLGFRTIDHEISTGINAEPLPN